jgi:hypothetical protein
MMRPPVPWCAMCCVPPQAIRPCSSTAAMARPRPPSCGPRARCAALRHQADGSVEAFLGGRTRLADGAVIGLLHVARGVVRSDDVVTAIAPDRQLP